MTANAYCIIAEAASAPANDGSDSDNTTISLNELNLFSFSSLPHSIAIVSAGWKKSNSHHERMAESGK